MAGRRGQDGRMGPEEAAELSLSAARRASHLRGESWAGLYPGGGVQNL